MLNIKLKLNTIYSLLIIITATGLEFYTPFILLNGPGVALFPAILAAHTCISLAAAFIFIQYLPETYRANLIISFSFFFLIGFFIPALGILGLCLALLPGLRHSKPSKQSFQAKLNGIPPLPSVLPKFSDSNTNRSDTAPANLLRSDNPNKRLDALIATLKLQDKDAVPLLRQALRDPEDDIRLLAYALIDRKEQKISDRIQLQLETSKPNAPSENLQFYKRIASDYWELAHSELVQGEMLSHTLDRAFDQVQAGLNHHPDDAGLRFQLARMLLRTGKLKEAQVELEKAEHLGINRKQLLPYFAEIEFSSKHFDKVKQYMQDISFPVPHSGLSASVHYWQEV